jgi:2-iminobutanoate/2-iminopropanoate deaminase
MPTVETSIPPGSPTPIGPNSHIAKVGTSITIGALGGVDPATGMLAGPDVRSQTRQALRNIAGLLASVDSDLDHVVHVTVFLAEMADFDALNEAYMEAFGEHRPARTVIGVRELPKPGLRLTMNVTAATRS